MNTIPETSAIGKPTVPRHGRRGFRVPFGLRDSRVWAPTEVASGKACGCVCPACHRPLVAKAQASRRRRPHFAHMVDLGCATGTETGIHLRAKQVICDQIRLLLPSWHGELLRWPNPPRLRDSAGNWHEGERVCLPEKRAVLLEAEPERGLGDYRPDVRAVDEEGVLLIEIRVTHAVDDAKSEQVCRDGLRMIEIDLSDIDRDIPHDAVAFDRIVLEEPGNRTWISCPSAEAAWAASQTALESRIAVINEELAEEAKRREREAQRLQEAARVQTADKAGRQDYMRRKLRKPHLDALAALPGLVVPIAWQLCRPISQRLLESASSSCAKACPPLWTARVWCLSPGTGSTALRHPCGGYSCFSSSS